MTDLREGVSPVVHRVLDKADALRVSMARFSRGEVMAEVQIEALASGDPERLAALAIVASEKAGEVAA